MRIQNLENNYRKFTQKLGSFQVLEYMADASVSPWTAEPAYFMSKMGVHRRQLVIVMDGQSSVVVQAGAMQWTAGNVNATTGIKGVGDLVGKMMKGAVTKESAVKPEYVGNGLLVLEPTYKFILLMDVGQWGPAGMTIEDGMFYACMGSVKQTVVSRKNMSSAVLGGEGMFNLALSGNGVAALESNVPFAELVAVDLENDELRIDGNLAICWSSNLQFTVERSTKTLIGSAVSGEGLVNVYRGTGRVLMSPVAPTYSFGAATNSLAAKAAAAGSNTFGK